MRAGSVLPHYVVDACGPACGDRHVELPPAPALRPARVSAVLPRGSARVAGDVHGTMVARVGVVPPPRRSAPARRFWGRGSTAGQLRAEVEGVRVARLAQAPAVVWRRARRPWPGTAGTACSRTGRGTASDGPTEAAHRGHRPSLARGPCCLTSCDGPADNSFSLVCTFRRASTSRSRYRVSAQRSSGVTRKCLAIVAVARSQDPVDA